MLISINETVIFKSKCVHQHENSLKSLFNSLLFSRKKTLYALSRMFVRCVHIYVKFIFINPDMCVENCVCIFLCPRCAYTTFINVFNSHSKVVIGFYQDL